MDIALERAQCPVGPSQITIQGDVIKVLSLSLNVTGQAKVITV